MKPLILESLEAHRKYVVSRIDCFQGKTYYQEMFETIQQYVQTFEDYAVLLFVLEHSFSQLRGSLFSLNRELEYKKLALKHASEVIVGINKRFKNAQS
jgi:hypothetical protein